MKQLSGSDNLFLVQEDKNVYNHVASLTIYDVSTAPGGKVRYKDILKHFADRMSIDPIFRQRLVAPPLGIDRPYWVEESEVDLEFHVRHIALPKPGDWRQLMIQVARLHSRPLDRSRPMWEAYVIEGLDNIPKLPPGSFAMFMKFHHASLDGMAGIRLGTRMHSETPATDMSDTETGTVYADRDPSAVELASRAVINGINRVVTAGKLSVEIAAKVAVHGRGAVGDLLRVAKGDSRGGNGFILAPAPKTRFNQAVSAHRVVDGFGMPLSRIKRVRARVRGATLNDIFLAVAGGAVRKYLLSKNELPERSLACLMPMALHSDGSAGGNAVSAAAVKVRSDIADPLARLKAAHHEAQAGKEQAELLGPEMLKNLLDTLPSAVGSLIVNRVLIPTLNMTVSNVRGPERPLYMAGAKAMCYYPVSIPTDGVGLNITGVSYNGVMWVSVVSCRSMLPDPDFFTTCMQDAWEEILAAADALPEEPAAATAKSRTTRATTTRKPVAARKTAPEKTALPEKPARARPMRTPANPVADTAKPAARKRTGSPATTMLTEGDEKKAG